MRDEISKLLDIHEAEIRADERARCMAACPDPSFCQEVLAREVAVAEVRGMERAAFPDHELSNYRIALRKFNAAKTERGRQTAWAKVQSNALRVAEAVDAAAIRAAKGE